MFKLNFKIALRNIQKNLSNTFINIGGMAVAVAAFITIILYVQYENDYDASNPNYKNIYLVGRKIQGDFSTLTSSDFARKIKAQIPEIEKVGKIKYTNFEFAISNKNARIYVKNVLSADIEASKILNFKTTDTIFKDADNTRRSFFLSESSLKTLFPQKHNLSPEMVTIGSVAAGQTGTVHGTFKEDLHANITFDGLALTRDIAEGMDSTDYVYTTFIQVKPHANIENLTKKLNMLYAAGLPRNAELIKFGDQTNQSVYLDALQNLHLQPKSGINSNRKVVNVILSLGVLILLLACINFVNINIVQSATRAKEIGVKKVMGANKGNLVIQFTIEIFIQCFTAATIALIITEFTLPVVNRIFEVNLSIWTSFSDSFWLIALTLLTTTLLAGLYPALVLSSYNPVRVLKGNFSNSTDNQWLKKSLLVAQFSIATAFITGLLLINRQLSYMQTEDKGFSANQVVFVQNNAIFNAQLDFQPVKDRIIQIDGVKSVSVTSYVPTGPKPSAQTFSIDGIDEQMLSVAVDPDFFETLSIKLVSGRFFSDKFGTDSSDAVILNEAAVKKYNLTNPIGKSIRSCNSSFQIIGVIKDLKAEGFEKVAEPTVYSLTNKCAEARTAILIKVSEGKASKALTTLKANWPGINKLDGEDFRYEFMDILYGKLFKKQEQLKFVFTVLSILTILIALSGLYAYAKFITRAKLKEIAVRKILGASDYQIFNQINNNFFQLVILSNIIVAPLIYIFANQWLAGFAYKQSISFVPFLITLSLTVLLSVLTVTIQGFRALKTTPSKALRAE